MSYKAIVSDDNDHIIQSIFNLLNIEPEDEVIWEVKDEIVQLKKFNPSKTPVSCRSLTEDDLKNELMIAIEAAENGETVSEEEVAKMMKKLRHS